MTDQEKKDLASVSLIGLVLVFVGLGLTTSWGVACLVMGTTLAILALITALP
jgi:hypothetical protein